MNQKERSNLASWLVFGTTLVLCAATLTTLASGNSSEGIVWTNQDVALTLNVGRSLFDGTRLYVDLHETNPPGIFLLTGAITQLSGWLRSSPATTYHTGVLTLGVFGSWMIRRVLSHMGNPVASTLVGLAYAMIIVLDVPLTDVQFISAFGQREHLFALVFAPYLLWRLLDNRMSSAARGLLVCVGYLANLKPHFALLILCLEILSWLEERRHRTQIWATLAVAAALPYAVTLLLAPRSMLAFLRVTVPYQWNGTYAYFNNPYRTFIHSPEHHWLLFTFTGMAYCIWPLWHSENLARGLKRAVMTLPLLAYFLVVQQGKFWEYQSIVVISVSSMLAILLFSIYLTQIPEGRARALLWLMSVMLTLQLGAALLARSRLMTDWSMGRGGLARMLKLAPILEGRKRVLYYSTSTSHLRLVVGLQQEMLGSYSHNFDYPSIIRDPNPSQRARKLANYCRQQTELIAATQPDAIVFYATGQALTSSTQELHPVLVEQCHVLPEGLYRVAALPELPEARVYLRD